MTGQSSPTFGRSWSEVSVFGSQWRAVLVKTRKSTKFLKTFTKLKLNWIQGGQSPWDNIAQLDQVATQSSLCPIRNCW